MFVLNEIAELICPTSVSRNIRIGAENGFAESDIRTENGLSLREATPVNELADSTAADATTVAVTATNVNPFTVFASAFSLLRSRPTFPA